MPGSKPDYGGSSTTTGRLSEGFQLVSPHTVLNSRGGTRSENGEHREQDELRLRSVVVKRPSPYDLEYRVFWRESPTGLATNLEVTPIRTVAP